VKKAVILISLAWVIGFLVYVMILNSEQELILGIGKHG